MTVQKKLQVVEFKRGDTFYLGCTAKDEAGVVVDLTSTQIRAQVRNPETNALVADLVVNWANRVAGEYELWWSGDGLIDCQPGCYQADIEYSTEVSGRPVVRSSETFTVLIVKDETR